MGGFGGFLSLFGGGPCFFLGVLKGIDCLSHFTGFAFLRLSIQFDVFGSQHHCGHRQQKQCVLHRVAKRIDNLIMLDSKGNKGQGRIVRILCEGIRIDIADDFRVCLNSDVFKHCLYAVNRQIFSAAVINCEQPNPGLVPIFMSGHQVGHEQHQSAGRIAPPPDINEAIALFGFFNGRPLIGFDVQNDDIAPVKMGRADIAAEISITEAQYFFGRVTNPIQQNSVGP